MIVADTGAVLALIDVDDRHHQNLYDLFVADPDRWVLPWAVLPEVDYLLAEHVSRKTEQLFVADLAAGAWAVEWGVHEDLMRAHQIVKRHRSLRLGLVDAIVIAVAERLNADAIATLDLRDFASVEIAGAPKLLPRDL